MRDQTKAASNATTLPRRILIVDDDMATRRLYRFLFSSNGYVVEEAIDGLAALEKMSAEWFPVVITDMNMPRMDGMELVQAIRSKHPNVYVIMVTAFGTIDTEKHALKSGADEYLAKPFEFEELEQRVNAFFLAQQRASQQLPR